MQPYLKTKSVIALVVILAAGYEPLVCAQESVKMPYKGKYYSLKCKGDQSMLGVLMLDSRLRYVAHVDNRRVQIWTSPTNLNASEVVYEGPMPIKDREVVGAAMTKDGLIFMVHFPYPKDEAYNQTFLWDPVLREVRRLKWPDKFNEFFSNSDGTKLARFRGEFDAGKSNYVSLVEIFDLNGSPLRTIKMNEKPEGLQPPFLIDRLENIYGVDQNAKQTRRVVSVIIAASQSYETISGAEALLIDDVQRISEPQKPMLLLLEDGLTLAAFVRDAKNTGLVSIQYYREGRLVKSVSDPVPQGVAEVRLTITSDGKGVLTQVVSGEKKGLVKVWDIETRKPSDITNAPPIRCVFQWVQGKYAPVWTFADDNIYEGALLEIARTRN